MPHSRLYHIAEEGKRNDDYPSRDWSSVTSSFLFWRGPSRFRRRRLLPVVVVVLLLYFLWTPDLGPPTRGASRAFREPLAKEEEGNSGQANYYYDGPIGFLRLGYTLYSAKGKLWRKNVLFAAASLKSASAMIPIACEMARYRRNGVHFTLLGRDDILIDDLLIRNGIENGCDVRWHDGRPDYSVSSTDSRMEASVFRAIGLINSIMNPWVIIVDNLEEEDAFFAKSIRAGAQSLRKPILELPKDAVENLMWITRLDCGSLSAWNEINIEIIIQVSPGESGSLIRLLESLKNADYFSLPPPGVTVELPPSVDGTMLHFLEDFLWPPPRSGKQQSGRLRLRRLMRHDATAEESSLHFLESFYPTNPSTSHVLILSPRVELSPLFYHYLQYVLLEYRYSSYGFQVSSKLAGIALNLPSTYLNATSSFHPPLARPSAQDQSRHILEGDQATPFLWQAPDSDAALYFGDKWVELQDFLASRLDAPHGSSSSPNRRKAISPKYPPWMEYFSELLRAMGYVMLYPNWESGGSFATVHYELPPQTAHFIDGDVTSEPEDEQNVLAEQSPIKFPHEPPLISGTTLVHILPVDGDLPELSVIPLLSFDGRRVSSSVLDAEAAEYAAAFRRETGGCGADIRVRSSRDLFCLEDHEVRNRVEATSGSNTDPAPIPISKLGSPAMSPTIDSFRP